MGDLRRIDHLRALALSSMPSLARRPQRRNSVSIDVLEQRKTTAPALPVTQDDKEEGELSSDDDAEHTATPAVAVESSLSFAHRNTGQSLRAPTQDKDERQRSAEAVPVVGLSSASVFSTSTRVSIVNKSQLFSAFTAQAPPLISSQTPEPVHNGPSLAQPKHNVTEVISSEPVLDNFVSNPHQSTTWAPSTAISQPIPTHRDLSRSQGGSKARSCEDSLTSTSAVTKALSPVSTSVTACVATEAVGGISAQALVVTGADVSIASGTAPAVSVFETPVVGSGGTRKEAGVRKEAEAFLASLRIPLTNSAASGDQKQDAFVIKFDDDSDSDGENENRTNPTRKHPDRRSQKKTTTSTGPMITNLAPQSNPVMPTQTPADLTAEIDRMKVKIAAMERTKGKTSIPLVVGKAVKGLSTDASRINSVSATEPRPGTQVAAVNVRPGSVDLESMRLRIAAKESELQQRRQRLVVKVPEGMGVSDPKRSGGLLASSLLPTVRSNQATENSVGYAGNPMGKSYSEKGRSGSKKESQVRADGIPALALAGPAGADLAAFKKGADQRGLDGCDDRQHLNGPVSNFGAVQVGSKIGRVTGQQLPIPKGIKRPIAAEEIGELVKVPKFNHSAVPGNVVTGDPMKNAALAGSLNDTLQAGRIFPSSVPTSKRKVDAGQMTFDKSVPGALVDSISAAGSEVRKKLKTNSGEKLIDSHPNELHAVRDIPSHDARLSGFARKETVATVPNDNAYLKTSAGALPYMVDGCAGSMDVTPAVSLAAPLPKVTERQIRSKILERHSDDMDISVNVMKNIATKEDAGASNAMAREMEQTAVYTSVAVTESQQETLRRCNPKSTFFPQDGRADTAQPWKLVNPVSSARFDYQVARSSHHAHSRIDDQLNNEEHISFQQLLEEEELLDKQLEDVQRIRQHCEMRERIARKEYREAQCALRAANEDSYALNQRKEFLLSRMHAAEARHLPGKSYIDRPLVPFGGTVATHNQNRPPEHPSLLVSAPYPLPVSRALDGSWEGDVHVDSGRSALGRESLSPSSSNRVDLTVIAHRNSKTLVSEEECEEDSHYKSAKTISTDDKERESPGLLVVGVESCERVDKHIAVGEKKVQAGFVNVERQEEEFEPAVFADGAPQAENLMDTRCESDLNHKSHYPASAGLDSGTGVPNFFGKDPNSRVRWTSTSDTGADELPQQMSLEESEQVPLKSLSLITIGCSKQVEELCSVDDFSAGGPMVEGLSAVCTEDNTCVDPVQPQVPRFDPPQVLVTDLEQEGSDKEYGDVKHLSASSSPQNAQSVDSLQSAPDLFQDMDSTDVHESMSMEYMQLTMHNTLQDDSPSNVSPGTHEDDSFPRHLNECSSDALALQNELNADMECGVRAGTEVLVAASLSTESAGQVEPERSYSELGTIFLEIDTKAVGSCARSRVYIEDVPFDPEGEAMLCSVSHNLEEAIETRGGSEPSNVVSLVEVPDERGLLTAEPDQFSSLLRTSAIDSLDEKENPDVALSHVEQVDPASFGNSSSKEASQHPHERKAEAFYESIDQRVSIGQRVSRKLRHSNGATDDSTILDLELQHAKDMESQGVADVEYPNGAGFGENSSAPAPGKCFLNAQEGFNRGVTREDCLEVPGAESTIFLSDNCLMEQSPSTINQVDHSSLFLENQHCHPLSEERYVDSQFVYSGNVDRPSPQSCADMSEDEHHDVSEVPQQTNFLMSLDENRTPEGSDYSVEDPFQDGDTDLRRTIGTEMITGNSEAHCENESESPDQDLATAVVAEDQQQDQLDMDIPESGEQKQEIAEKKETKGADVEVFRQALLHGNMFERRSSSGDVADTTNSRKQTRDEVSTQILPQLQHHRLEHLLDMVEVRVPELSSIGDTLVQDCPPGAKDAGSPVEVDDMQLDTPTPERHDIVVQFDEQAHLSGVASDDISDTAEHWVPSAQSLAVLSFIPRTVMPPANSDTRPEIERMPSEWGSNVSTGQLVSGKYQSPLSIFRSYRINDQFSNVLHLSLASTTWSHAIDPFKPLCKFEHRGKCNNDDCPWQHADDYKLSSSQIASQIQSYASPRGKTSDEVDVAVTSKDRELALACVSSPTEQSPVTATVSEPLRAGPRNLLPKSSMVPVSSPLKGTDSDVPIYRVGSYTLRTVDPSRMCLQLSRKVGGLHSFLLSPSIHRPLPSDMPCLLDASDSSSWFPEAPAYHPGSPHWRYMRDIQEKLKCTKDGGELQELMDEELWLELALHQIDYDISTDNNKARDLALYYLSRALESKQCSVALWVVYSCLFHMRKDSTKQDDMFHHAVQYNPGSYELWVLYINSRSDFQSRLEAYEKAMVALVNEGTQLDTEELSACLLDIGLQMLYFLCVSGRSEDSFSWVNDLICEASAQDDIRPHRESTCVLLCHLTPRHGCVLWIACTYLLACKHLPNCIITRLGCEQELPDGLEWGKYAKLDELTHKSVMRALSTAASDGVGCLSLGSGQPLAGKEDFAREVLGVNYVQCLAFYEGLKSAARFGKELTTLHPTSLELIVLCARIDEHCKDFTAGLRVFEEAVSKWPHDRPGKQRLWNQYAGHALLWGGEDLARTVLANCAATKKLPTRPPVSIMSLIKTERTDHVENKAGDWGHLREYFVGMTSAGKRNDAGAISSHQSSQVEDTVYALINLALTEALSGDMSAAQSAINSAMKAAISHKDLRHSWRELAAFQQAFCAQSAGQGDRKMLEHSMLSLLDRCKTDSYNLSQLRPLGVKAFQSYKKPHVRKFLEDLISSPPIDHSVLNSILGTFYGPELLPSSDSYPWREVFHFAEGILEALPGNVRLASSLCQLVGQSRSTLKRTYMSAVMWATALLTSALHHSCPVAPEAFWVEAGSMLRQLEDERSLEEFYNLACVKYPFSATLRRCLQEVQDGRQVVQQKTPQLAEPMQAGLKG